MAFHTARLIADFDIVCSFCQPSKPQLDRSMGIGAVAELIQAVSEGFATTVTLVELVPRIAEACVSCLTAEQCATAIRGCIQLLTPKILQKAVCCSRILFFLFAIGRLFGGTPPSALDAFVSMLAQRQTRF